MKKFIPLTMAAVLALTPVTASAIDVQIDGAPLVMDTAAASINGRTMVPMRAIFEALGAEVTWDGATKGITATSDSGVINLYLDNADAFIDDQKYTLDAPPVSVNGRTMVPARFVAEAMGCTVGWDASTQTVKIATNKAEDSATDQTELSKDFAYKVLRVVDGDTFVIDFNGTEEKVRLIGVDTAESVHPNADKNTEAGVVASEYTKSLLDGKSVELEFDVQERDQYGRLLAYAYVDGYMLNKKLLEDGYAKVATYPPNVKYVDDFKAIAEITDNEIPAEPKKPTSTAPAKENELISNTTNAAEATYIGNSKTKKFHETSCSSVKKMNEANKVGLEDRESALSLGYDPCGICKP